MPKRLVVAALVISIASACGGSNAPPVAPPPPPSPPPPNKFEQTIADMTGFRDKMCGCSDRACADRVNDDYKEWRKAMRGKFTKDDDKIATDDQTRRAKAADEAFHDCRRKLRSGSTKQVLAKMAEFKDKMCVCKDKACADKVTDEMTRWSAEMARSAEPEEGRVSEDDTKKMAQLTEDFVNCATKAMSP